MVPTKVSNDYGIDFICQVVKPLPSDAQDIRPIIIGAVVKSSGKKSNRPRAQLQNDDIELALKSEFPLLFVLVDLLNDEVYLRFFDMELLTVFHDTFSKGKHSFLLTPRIMFSGAENFQEALNCIGTPEYQQRLRIKAVEFSLNSIIGNARLQIRSDGRGGLAILELPCLENLFLPEDRAQVREVILTSRYDFPLRLPFTRFQDSIIGEIRRFASKLAIIAPIPTEGYKTIYIMKHGRIKAGCVFNSRSAGDEVSFHHQSGLSIIISESREGADGLHYHHTRVSYGDDSSGHLFEHPEIIAFIKECDEDTEICLGKPSKQGIPINHFSELLHLRLAVTDTEIIYKELDIPNPVFKFHHFLDEKIQRSFGLLSYPFNSNRDEDIWPGFVTTPEETSIDWVRATIFCPLFVALPEGASVVQIEFLGKMGFSVNYPVGARFDKYIAMRVCEPFEYGGSLTDPPYAPILLIDGKNAIKLYSNRFERVESPCEMSIGYRLEE